MDVSEMVVNVSNVGNIIYGSWKQLVVKIFMIFPTSNGFYDSKR